MQRISGRHLIALIALLTSTVACDHRPPRDSDGGVGADGATTPQDPPIMSQEGGPTPWDAGPAIDVDGGDDVHPDAGADHGDGGSPIPPLPPCEDRGPCVVTSRDAEDRCVHSEKPDGTPCSDQQVCTANDECLGGQCVGEAIESTAQVRGSLHTFGASPHEERRSWRWPEGLATFVDEERILFAESTNMSRSRIHLVEVGERGLELLDSVESELEVASTVKTTLYWRYSSTSYLVEVAPGLFALSASGLAFDSVVPPGIELFVVDDKSLRSVSFTELPSTIAEGIQLNGAAGHGGFLWLCGDALGGDMILGFELDDEDGSFEKIAELGVTHCNELALSPDGQTLYSVGQGLRPIDLSDPTDPQPGDRVLGESFFEMVDATETLVALLSIRPAGQLGNVEILRASDLEHLWTIPATTEGGPVGVAIDGNRLLVEHFDFRDQGGPSLTAEVYTIGEAGRPSEIGAWTVRKSCCHPEGDTAVRPVLRGNHAVLQPWRSVVRIDAESGAIRPLTGALHGSMERVRDAGEDRALALGRYASHLIDISDPDAPSVIAGGQNLPRTTRTDRFDVDLGGRARETRSPGMLLGRSPLVQEAHALRRWSLLDGAAFPPALSSFTLPAPGGTDDAAVAIDGNQLVQVRNEGDDGFRIRRFAISPEAASPISLVDEHVIELEGEAQGRTLSRPLVALDERRSVLALLYYRGEDRTIAMYALDPDGPTLLAASPAGEWDYFQEIHLSGDRIVLAGDGWLGVVERQGTELETIATYTAPSEPAHFTLLSRILHFDGDEVFVASRSWERDLDPPVFTWTIEELDADDLSSIATYIVPDDPLSMTGVGNRWVIGMNNGLTVADPSCDLPL